MQSAISIHSHDDSAPTTPHQTDSRNAAIIAPFTSPPSLHGENRPANLSRPASPTKSTLSSNKMNKTICFFASADAKWALMQASRARLVELTSALGNAKRSSDHHAQKIEELTNAVRSARFDAALSAAKLQEAGAKVESLQSLKSVEHWERVKCDVAEAMSDKRALFNLRRETEEKESESVSLKSRIEEDRAAASEATKRLTHILQESTSTSGQHVDNNDGSDLFEEVERMRRVLEERERAHAQQRDELIAQINQMRLSREVSMNQDDRPQSIVEGCNCSKCLAILKRRAHDLEVQLESSRAEHARLKEAVMREAAEELTRSMIASISPPTSLSAASETITAFDQSLTPSTTPSKSEDKAKNTEMMDMTSFALSDRIMGSLRSRAMEIHEEAERQRFHTLPHELTWRDLRARVGTSHPVLSSPFKISMRAGVKPHPAIYSEEKIEVAGGQLEHQGSKSHEASSIRPLALMTLDTINQIMSLSP